MKIAYLSDVKKALKDVPDDVLAVIGWGCGDGMEEEVGMCVWDEDYFMKWEEYTKKYPQLNDISKWIDNIKEAQSILDSQEETEQFDAMEEPISSDYKFEKQKGEELSK